MCIWIWDGTRLTSEEVNLGPEHYKFPRFGSGLYKFTKPWSSLLPLVVFRPYELSALEHTHAGPADSRCICRKNQPHIHINFSFSRVPAHFACTCPLLPLSSWHVSFTPSFLLPTLSWIFQDESLIKWYFRKEYEKQTQTNLLYKEHRPCFLTGPIWNWFLLNRWSNR